VRTVTALILLAVVSSAAHAQKRVALVIGNSAYQHTPELTNPKNDASDLAAVVKKHGFQVIEGFDLDKVAFDRKVRDFAAALKGSDAGVFFYAGHGLQVAGQNYLVPVDAKGEGAEVLEFEMVRVDVIHRIMERQTNTNILFLDACRNNPLARNLARSMGTRSSDVGRGLAAVESGVGTLISFSTQPGNVALDGAGRNSPFAGALVKQLSSSNDDLSAILIAVRNDVMIETQRKQVPWEHSALTGRFYFNLAAQVTESIKKMQPAPLNEAAESWAAAKDTTSIPVLEAFVARYSNMFYADLARARIDELEKQRAAMAASPTVTTNDAQASSAPDDLAWDRVKDKKDPEEFRHFIAQYQNSSHWAEAGARLAELTRLHEVTNSAQNAARDLARTIQEQLTRVGCDPGDIAGEWGSKTKDALRQFARATKLSLPTDTPTDAALLAVMTKEGRVCPLVCDAGKKELNGKCVARAEQTKTKVAKQRSTGKVLKSESEPPKTSCFTKCWAETQGRGGGYGGASMGATNCTATCGGR
jgi:uncharacterized caspase-like protein